MLHILWLILKFILIILGILLGLALLAVLLLLFCPVRYQARAVKETGSFKETELEARITWLFHVIGVRFCFHNGEGKLVILFFGVSLETIKGWLKKLKGGRRKNSVSQTSRSKANRKNVTDATEELVQLSIAKSEGYTDVKITGSRLDMDTDFKVWLGIIRSMSEYGVKSDTLELSFVEFV